jgi:hypothetical protein
MMPQTFWTAAETVSVADRFGNVTRLDQNHASVRNHENQLDQRHNCAIFAPVREAQSGSVVLSKTLWPGNPILLKEMQTCEAASATSGAPTLQW